MSDLLEAKPCPFCGEKSITLHEGSTFRWMVAECNGCGATCGEVRVQTMGPGLPAHWKTKAKQDAVEKWNNRAANSATEDGMTDSHTFLTNVLGWRPIASAPKDGSHVLLYRPVIQFVGYYGGADSGWRINAPGLPAMWPLPTHWAPLRKPPNSGINSAKEVEVKAIVRGNLP